MIMIYLFAVQMFGQKSAKGETMIYSQKQKQKRCNFSTLEKAMLKKLKNSKQAQWMVAKPLK